MAHNTGIRRTFKTTPTWQLVPLLGIAERKTSTWKKRKTGCRAHVKLMGKKGAPKAGGRAGRVDGGVSAKKSAPRVAEPWSKKRRVLSMCACMYVCAFWCCSLLSAQTQQTQLMFNSIPPYIMHPYIHTSTHPYIHTSIHPCIHTSVHPYTPCTSMVHEGEAYDMVNI
jgi:hypothetical protein